MIEMEEYGQSGNKSQDNGIKTASSSKTCLIIIALIVIFAALAGIIIFVAFLSDDEEEKEKEKINPDSFAINPVPTFDENNALKDEGNEDFDDTVTQAQVVEEMGFGWNLGNALDANNETLIGDEGLSSEIGWRNPYTTEKMIKMVKDLGFRTLRIPITWHNHLIDDKYTINPKWMQRVKEIVEWGLKYKLYVIINIHHDNLLDPSKDLKYGQGYYPNTKNIKESEKFIFNVWKQITLAFNKGYDHHLIFEALNEPRLTGTKYEWAFIKGDPICEDGVKVVNEFNRLALKAIRESGGNNEKRFVMVTALAANYGYFTESNFVIPDDSKYNPKNKKILASVHMYTPYDFVLNGDMKYDKFTKEYEEELALDFKTIWDKFTSKGQYVIIGETGTCNKNNTNDRLAWGRYYLGNARRYHMAVCMWDNGYWDNSETADDILGHMIRNETMWYDEDFLEDHIKYGSLSFKEAEKEFKE